jgi:hypothetical protein
VLCADAGRFGALMMWEMTPQQTALWLLGLAVLVAELLLLR